MAAVSVHTFAVFVQTRVMHVLTNVKNMLKWVWTIAANVQKLAVTAPAYVKKWQRLFDLS
ncbi:hypothetical protein [Dyadobacter sediminis]|uniref:hypothetical protein n=1 Tax=Dyadobacter sediminis TaxID=1493691 RepID=UPI001983F63E|nr:hypothetical protein GCM10011325_08680 [Dyadobacter sediminis]